MFWILDFILLRRAAPSKHILWQLAQLQLNMERMRADHNLLLVVGHANLLHFLADLGDEQTQRF
jgi:hypothetical protein